MDGYKFTDRTRKVLAMAREEAVRLSHEYVGTEHIILAMVREGEGVAATALQNLNVELDEIRQAIDRAVKKGRATQATGPDLPYTSRAKKVLELAMREARVLNHSYVGTEHLLLGLLAEERGIAAQVVRSFGVTLDNARAEVLRILGTELTPQTAREEPHGEKPVILQRTTQELGTEPPHGEKPAHVRLTLYYSNGAVVSKSFTDAADAASFLSAQ